MANDRRTAGPIDSQVHAALQEAERLISAYIETHADINAAHNRGATIIINFNAPITFEGRLIYAPSGDLKMTGEKSEFHVYGDNLGAVGTNPVSRNNIISKVASGEGYDFARLTEQITALKMAMRTRQDPANDDHHDAISAVMDAEKAARRGDQTGVVAGLKKAGQWALDIAKDLAKSVSVDLVKEILEAGGGV